MDFEELYAEPEGRADRLHGLALPFALIGAYGGWVVTRLLAGPLRVATSDLPPAAIALGLASGLVAGVVVARTVRRRLAQDERRITWLLVRTLVPLGALAGGLSMEVTSADVVTSVGLGVAASAALLPFCAHVAQVAVRASRARLGSVMAAADRRSIGLALTGAMAVGAGVEAYEWWGFRNCWYAGAVQSWYGAHVGMVVAGVCTAVAGGLRHRQRRVQSILEAHAVAAERMDDGGGLGDGDPRRVDVGLGDDAKVLLAHHGSAYRHARRPVAMVVGDATVASLSAARLVERATWVVVVCGLSFLTHVAAALTHDSAARVRIRGRTTCICVAEPWGPPPPIVAPPRQRLRRRPR